MSLDWDPVEEHADRAAAVAHLLSTVIHSSAAPLRERDLVALAGRHLDEAWADWSSAELRTALDLLDDPATARLDHGRVVSLTPPADLDETFDRSLLVEQAAERVAEIEAPPSTARGWNTVPGLFDVPLLSPEHERRLALRTQRGDRDAINALVKANTRLCVQHVRRRLAAPAIDNEDQLQEAMLGVIRAAEKFDVRMGFRFSTYATWWIRQGIARAVADNGRTIRLPVHVGGRLT